MANNFVSQDFIDTYTEGKITDRDYHLFADFRLEEYPPQEESAAYIPYHQGGQYSIQPYGSFFGSAHENIVADSEDLTTGNWIQDLGVPALTDEYIKGRRYSKVTASVGNGQVYQVVSLTGDGTKCGGLAVKKGDGLTARCHLYDATATAYRYYNLINFDTQTITTYNGTTVSAEWVSSDEVIIQWKATGCVAANTNRFYCRTVTASKYMMFTAVQVTDLDYNVPYVDPLVHTTLTRPAREETNSISLPTSGTVTIYQRVKTTWTTPDDYCYLWIWYADVNNRIYCRSDNSLAKILTASHVNSVINSEDDDGNTNFGEWIEIVWNIDIDNDTIDWSIDGAIQTQITSADFGTFGSNPNTFSIGWQSFASLYYTNAQIPETKIFIGESLSLAQIKSGATLPDYNWTYKALDYDYLMPRVWQSFNGPGSFGMWAGSGEKNLILYPEDLTNAYWTKDASMTCTLPGEFVKVPGKAYELTKCTSGAATNQDVYRRIYYTSNGCKSGSVIMKRGDDTYQQAFIYDATAGTERWYVSVSWNTKIIDVYDGTNIFVYWIDDDTVWIFYQTDDIVDYTHTYRIYLRIKNQNKYGYFTAVQVEDAEFPSPYIDPNQYPGGIRNALGNQYLVTMPEVFLFDIEFTIFRNYDSAANSPIAFQWEIDSNNALWVYYDLGLDMLVVWWKDGGSAQSLRSHAFTAPTGISPINQKIRMVGRIDLSTGTDLGSWLYIKELETGRITYDAIWTGNIDAKDLTYNILSVGAQIDGTNQFDGVIHRLDLYLDSPTIENVDQIDSGRYSDEATHWGFNGHSTGRTRCDISYFNQAYARTLEKKNAGGHWATNKLQSTIRNNNAEFSDDQYAAYDPANPGVGAFNGLDATGERYLASLRSGITLETWDSTNHEREVQFFGYLDNSRWRNKTKADPPYTVNIKADDMVSRIAGAVSDRALRLQQKELASSDESDSLIHKIVRKALQRKVVNYAAGASFEDATISNSWDYAGTGATLTRAAGGLFGDYEAQWAYGSSAGNIKQFVTFDGDKKLNVGETYNFSMFWKCSAALSNASTQMQLQEFKDGVSQSQSTNSTVALSGGEGWVRFNVSHTIVESDTNELRIVGQIFDAGVTVSFDGAMLIEGTRPPNIFVWKDNEGTAGSVSAATADSNSLDPVDDTSLVGWWSLDERRGSTAYDDSLNGNDGTLCTNFATDDSQWVDGAASGALEFNGTDEWVDCGTDSSLQPTGAVSVCCWLKADVTSGSYDMIAANANGNSLTVGYGLFFHNDEVRFYVDHYSTNRAWKAFTDTDNWHFVAGTYDGATVRIYVDCEEGTSDTFTPPIDYTGAVGFLLGASNPSATVYLFDGKLDDVRVYNRALSEAEIKRLFQEKQGWYGYNTCGFDVEPVTGKHNGGTQDYRVRYWVMPENASLWEPVKRIAQASAAQYCGMDTSGDVFKFRSYIGDWDDPDALTTIDKGAGLEKGITTTYNSVKVRGSEVKFAKWANDNAQVIVSMASSEYFSESAIGGKFAGYDVENNAYFTPDGTDIVFKYGTGLR